MDIQNTQLSASSIHQQIALKKSELASIDKKDEQKSLFEKHDTISSTPKNYDEQDYKRVLDKFENMDSKIRAHEQAHAAGANTIGSIQYSYQMGPDGKLYANGGSVRFDTSMPKDEEAALAKLQEIEGAASAPNELSFADANIARTASLNRMLFESQGESYDN